MHFETDAKTARAAAVSAFTQSRPIVTLDDIGRYTKLMSTSAIDYAVAAGRDHVTQCDVRRAARLWGGFEKARDF